MEKEHLGRRDANRNGASGKRGKKKKNEGVSLSAEQRRKEKLGGGESKENQDGDKILRALARKGLS